jgi:hypothetical protein
MMLDDLEKYLSDSWKGHWQGMTQSTKNLLIERYGKEKADELIEKHGFRLGSKKTRTR